MHFLIKSIVMMSALASAIIYSFFRYIVHLQGNALYVKTILFMSNSVSLIIVTSVVVYMILKK